MRRRFHRNRQARVALFGHFGALNLGNECTLKAIAGHLRTRVPDVAVTAICTDPSDVQRRHTIDAVSIRFSPGLPRREGSRMRGRLAAAVLRLRAEAADLIRLGRLLRGTDILVVAGTGILTDASERPFGFPYDVFKWAAVARLCRTRVKFVAVGVGPIYSCVSRWFFAMALRFAAYRSYRDSASRTRLVDAGIRVVDDPVVPDLAFSLGPSVVPPTRIDDSMPVRVVGVGVMDYFGPGDRHSDAIHREYLQRMARFVGWLLDQGFTVRLLEGDHQCDPPVRHALVSLLREAGRTSPDAHLINEDVTSIDDLVSQLRQCDVIVSPRFHNQVIGIMLNKPVLGISYDVKTDALMSACGLGFFCHAIDDLDLGRLQDQFSALVTGRVGIARRLAQKTEENRQTWADEYTRIFAELDPCVSPVMVRPAEAPRDVVG